MCVASPLPPAQVSSAPRVGLSELEARLEILRPEDLRVTKFLGAGGYGEVYLCRWVHGTARHGTARHDTTRPWPAARQSRAPAPIRTACTACSAWWRARAVACFLAALVQSAPP